MAGGRNGLQVALLLCAACMLARAQTAPAVATPSFDEIFGQRKTRSAQKIAIPLRIDGQERGLVDAEISGTSVRVNRTSLQSLIEDMLREESRQALTAQSATWLSMQDLAGLGLQASYDPARIALTLTVPLEQRKTVHISLNRRGQGPDGRRESLYKPQPWSLIVNTRWNHARSESNFRADTTVTDTLFADAALHRPVETGGWTLEHRGYVRSGVQTTANGWKNQLTRAVRDWPAGPWRLVIGDFTSPYSQDLSSQNLVGLQWGHQWSLRPGASVQPLPSQGLTLPAGGALDVEVNGLITSTLRLGPGNYQLADIPLLTGANDVVLYVYEPGGRVQSFERKYFFDASLLRPGLTAWNVSAGLVKQFTGAVRSDSPALLTAQLLRGITPTLTLGGAWQSQLSNASHRGGHLLQLQGTWASTLGTWVGQGAYSMHAWGGAASYGLQWRWSPGFKQAAGSTVTVQMRQEQDGFAPAAAEQPGAGMQDLGVRLGVQLPGGWNGSWSVQQLRMPSEARRVMVLTARRNLTRQWSLETSLQGQHSRAARMVPDEGPVSTFYIGLRYRPAPQPDSTQHWSSFTQWSQSSDREARWAETLTGQGSTVWMDADALWRTQIFKQQQGSLDETRLQGELLASRYHLNANVQQSVRDELSSTNWDTTFSSALILSPAGVHVSAPVADSAAVFVPRPGYGSLRLFVDPRKRSSAASSDRWGLPVLNTLMSHSPRQLQLDIDPLPAGMNIGDTLPWVQPGYRSVVAVPFGSDANTQVKGQLNNAGGQALAMTALRITRLDENDAQNSFELFTNRRGQFTSPPLKPGRYVLTVPGEAEILHRWTISPQDSGIKSLGALVWTSATQ